MSSNPTAQPPADDIVQLLSEVGERRDGAADELFVRVYGELHAIAVGFMGRERDDHTLQPTALVHEAFLRLVGQRSSSWQNRAHFLGVAAMAMRRILVDHARRRRAGKRHGGHRVTLDDDLAITEDGTVDVLLVDQALAQLARLDERQAKIVEMRFFGGLTIEQIAEALGISAATVGRDWVLARAWLYRSLGETA